MLAPQQLSWNFLDVSKPYAPTLTSPSPPPQVPLPQCHLPYLLRTFNLPKPLGALFFSPKYKRKAS